MKQDLHKMQRLFELIDEDGNGVVAWDEFQIAFEDPEIKVQWQALHLESHDCEELFDLLGGSQGEIPTKDFFDGLQKIREDPTSKDIFRLTKYLEELLCMQQHLLTRVEILQCNLDHRRQSTEFQESTIESKTPAEP